MKFDDSHAIRGLPLFAGISDAGFQHLTQAAFLQRFPAQVTLINEGESADFLHIVLDGLVEMFAAHGDRETVLTIVEPIATFILAAVVTDQVYLKSARTLTQSRILMLPADPVRAVFDDEPAFARAVVFELGLRYREEVRELKNQKLRTGTERLAAWLLGQATEEGLLPPEKTDEDKSARGADGKEASFDIPFEKRVLASRLGMTPENLSRAFASLASYGVVTSGRSVTLNDTAALQRLARPHRLIDDWVVR
ncbi:MAG TPA: helix-turn-helix domain-containing protein [Saliniramus sp.]|nr:helix-turn-helix domain-containing protein [Saliniramus sp.]